MKKITQKGKEIKTLKETTVNAIKSFYRCGLIDEDEYKVRMSDWR